MDILRLSVRRLSTHCSVIMGNINNSIIAQLRHLTRVLHLKKSLLCVVLQLQQNHVDLNKLGTTIINSPQNIIKLRNIIFVHKVQKYAFIIKYMLYIVHPLTTTVCR